MERTVGDQSIEFWRDRLDQCRRVLAFLHDATEQDPQNAFQIAEAADRIARLDRLLIELEGRRDIKPSRTPVET